MDDLRIAENVARRIGADAGLDPKLAVLKTKRAVMDYILRQTRDMPGMKGYVSDDYWKCVHDVFKRIESLGIDLTVSTDSSQGGDYFKVKYGDEWLVSGKCWLLEMEFDGVRRWKIGGRLRATFQEPGDLSSRYSCTLVLW